MNNKNILFTIVLSISLLSLIVGIISPVKKKMNTIDVQNTKNKSNINKIINSGYNKVAIIELSGVISSTPDKNILSDENSSLSALKAINEAESDKSVKGIIIRINSPGGTVGMSQRLYSAVINARKVKPVIAVMDDVTASGGYYVASACDRITSLPGTITGSIGVIMSTMDFQDLLTDKLGISENVVKSGKYKDIGSSTRHMTKEEWKILQSMVDDSYDQFINAIINGRINRTDSYKADKKILTEENLLKYADGRVFTGRQALEYGFVDSNGGMREAQKMMQSILEQKHPGISGINYVEYGKINNFLNALGLNQTSSSFENLVPQSIKYARKPLYLWE